MAEMNFLVSKNVVAQNVPVFTETTISTGSETTIASFSKTSAESAECIVKVKQGDRRFSDKVLVLHNGTTSDFTEYGELSLTATAAGVTIWTTRTSNFGNTSVQSVAYGNALWVAGGVSGQLRTSTDAITWTTRTSNFGTTRINSVAYGNSLWVAVGVAGQLRSSTDAITWVTQTSNFSTTTITSIASGNSLWAAGGSAGQLRTSIADSASYHVGGLTSSASVIFNTDISGSDVRLRMTIPDAALNSATVKVLTTTVGES